MPTARQSFSAYGRVVRQGQTVDRSDPILDGREHLFDDVPSRRPVEQATAAPGETRNVGVACDVDGCDYEGSAHGLKIHTARAHADD